VLWVRGEPAASAATAAAAAATAEGRRDAYSGSKVVIGMLLRGVASLWQCIIVEVVVVAAAPTDR
jgi:hypothetical protein